MNKRYQVFVSSTYTDLQEERQEVMHALLELDCIPAGMELFPAANEDQWSLIRKVIDDCDYYIVIIGGRYGSVDVEGVGYTEKEYRYAIETNKPVISFLHKTPGKIPAEKSEQNVEGKGKLKLFRELAETKMCKYWTNPDDLGSVVSRSLIKLMNSNPAVGWVKADQVPSVEATTEILLLRKQVESLQIELQNVRLRPPKDSEKFAQGDDVMSMRYTFRGEKDYTTIRFAGTFSATWNEIFAFIAPRLIGEERENEIYRIFSRFVRATVIDDLKKDTKTKEYELSNFLLNDEDFQTIKVQLRALGLITKNLKNRSVKDTETYWTLTPFGDNLMNTFRAILKEKVD